MKKIIVFFIMLEMIFLTSCNSLAEILQMSQDQVEIGSEVYRTGFYGDLWPANLSFTGEEYEVNGITFRRLDCGAFDCVQADIGGKMGGTIYCLDSQWEEANSYYADGENYTYYCGIDVYATIDTKQIFEIEDIDLEKYDELIKHAASYSYDPFDIVKNKVAEYKEVIIYTAYNDPRPYINFYKESKDGNFISFKAYYFFILDGTMYLARYHNMSEGTVSAVEVPEETASYFIEMVEGFLEE